MGRPIKNYRPNLSEIDKTIPVVFNKIYQLEKNKKPKVVGYVCQHCSASIKNENTLDKHQLSCKRLNTIYDYSNLKIIRNIDMPIQTVTVKGEKMYRWGDSGKLYRNRADAEKQAAAAYASGYKEKKDMKK